MSKTIADAEKNVCSRAGLVFPAVSLCLTKYIALAGDAQLSQEGTQRHG